MSKNQVIRNINDVTRRFLKCPKMIDRFFERRIATPIMARMNWFFGNPFSIFFTSYVWNHFLKNSLNIRVMARKPANFHLKCLWWGHGWCKLPKILTLCCNYGVLNMYQSIFWNSNKWPNESRKLDHEGRIRGSFAVCGGSHVLFT